MEEGIFLNSRCNYEMHLHCIESRLNVRCRYALAVYILRYGIVVLPQVMLVALEAVYRLLRNQHIYYRSYKAEAAGQKPKGILVFHHGYGCYCAFYDQGDIAFPEPLQTACSRRQTCADTTPAGHNLLRIVGYRLQVAAEERLLRVHVRRSQLWEVRAAEASVHALVCPGSPSSGGRCIHICAGEFAALQALHVCCSRQHCCILHQLHLFGIGKRLTQHYSASTARECMHAAGSGAEVPGLSSWPAYVDGRRLDGGHGGNPDSHPQAEDVEGMRPSHSYGIYMLAHPAQEHGCF